MCEPPNRVQIPGDASHIAFWKLYEMLHHTTIEWPDIDIEDSIGAEVLKERNLYDSQTIDLRNANDLITPLAAAMAIGGGGEIVGASHAQFKESDRIGGTVEMLASYSIEVEGTSDGMRITGGQYPTKPLQIVPTFGDHRMQMTAVILATRVGAMAVRRRRRPRRSPPAIEPPLPRHAGGSGGRRSGTAGPGAGGW